MSSPQHYQVATWIDVLWDVEGNSLACIFLPRRGQPSSYLSDRAS
jgi:hypothetical protein